MAAASEPAASTPPPNAAIASEPAGAEAARQEREARQLAGQQAADEAAQAEARRVAAERAETLRREAARLEAERKAAARAEAARVAAENEQAARREAERVEAAGRAEAARLAAARLEAAAAAEATRREAQRVEAERAEAERVAAERQRLAGLEALRQAEREAARHEAARLGAARRDTVGLQALEAEQQREARREAVLRAIGHQLDEEAAQRDAARRAEDAARGQGPRDARPPAWSPLRRGRLWGRTDANAELVRYAEAWGRRVQFNTPPDLVRQLAQRPHSQPLVTVAMRRDGSVESVTFVVSSGVPEIDSAIRRLVSDLAPYPAFSPALARDYDVIEIRRTWSFDSAVRLD